MSPKVIKTEAEHSAALDRIEQLFKAKAGSAEGDELELLTLLVDQYENTTVPIGLPSPLAAIQFRMQQQGLKNKDLIPYLGSASKVSEILSGRRGLSLAMIRNLVNGLGIPAESLLACPGERLPGRVPVEKFPLKEMYDRGWFTWFSGTWSEAREISEDLLLHFFNNNLDLQAIPALHRQMIRSGSKEDPFALHAWKTRVIRLATAKQIKASFEPQAITDLFLGGLRALSRHSQGPQLAIELLEQYGIAVVVEPHLKGTHLDGAALRLSNGTPVIALTLRHDRLDNYWFCLFHELAHVVKHLWKNEADAFFDNLDAADDGLESEADQFACDGLIPSEAWSRIKRRPRLSAGQIDAEARSLLIHPAIIAGRVRRERSNYAIFSELIGQGKVRPLFPKRPQ